MRGEGGNGYEKRKICIQQEAVVKKHPKVPTLFIPKSNSGNNEGLTSSVTCIYSNLSSNDCKVKSIENAVLSEEMNSCMHELKYQYHNCKAFGDLALVNNITHSREY